ncbi:MAG: ABC transporter substrate-binding protein [Pseudomonadota bacterium]
MTWLARVLTAMTLGLPMAAQAAPERVVSMNLCTDQLAMLIGPTQVLSVSYLASDPRSSAMVEEARGYRANRGLAEEIFLLKPDLVIAGTYTTRATVSLLRRLNIPVVAFKPANSLDDIRDRVAQMGEVLDQQDRAEALIIQFDADLAAVRSKSDDRPRAATYYANSYTSGPNTLAGSIMDAAGLTNIAIERGLDSGGTIALEELVIEDPDLIITGRPYDTPALAEEVLRHPALVTLRADTAPVADRDWVCGTPFVVAAIRRLVKARDAVLVR